jgi:hypothetical protein
MASGAEQSRKSHQADSFHRKYGDQRQGVAFKNAKNCRQVG